MLGVLKIEEASWFNPAGKKKVVTVSGIPASCRQWEVRSDGATVGGNVVVYHVDLGDGELQFHHVEVSYRWSGLGPAAAVHLSPVVLYHTI
ncbi:unnamed protein product [Brassica oleracea]